MKVGGVFLALLTCFGISHAVAESFKVPELTGPLVDEAGWLSLGDRSRIENLLVEMHRQGKAQMAVYIPESLQGQDIESASLAVAEVWKLGKRGVDNGLLLMVSPKERAMRIEVGYGLEGVLTDAKVRRILDLVLKPELRSSRPGDGIFQTVVAIGHVLEMDLSTVPAEEKSVVKKLENAPGISFNGILIFIVVLIFFLRRRRFGPFPRQLERESGAGFLTGLLLGRVGGIYRSGRGGVSGGFRGGGGSFGGGGATSRW